MRPQNYGSETIYPQTMQQDIQGATIWSLI